MVRRFLPALVLLGLALTVLAGCFDDDSDEPVASPRVTSTPRVTETATPATPPRAPTPTATPPRAPPASETATPAAAPTYGVWSVDAETLAIAVLHEGEDPAGVFRLTDEGLWLNVWSEDRAVRYAPDWRVLEESDQFVVGSVDTPRCEQDERGDLAARIDGVGYEANCGPFSPDGLKMLYTVEAGPGAGVPLAEYRAWVLDLEGGSNTELNATLRHCGGCDGIAGPSWSPSGRYLLVGETYTGFDSRCASTIPRLGRSAWPQAHPG